jgi:hypothetical protein
MEQNNNDEQSISKPVEWTHKITENEIQYATMPGWSTPHPRVKSSATARHKSTKTKRKWDTGGKGCACEKTTEAEEAPQSVQLPLHVEDVPPHPTPLNAGAQQPRTFAGPGPIPRCHTWFPNSKNAEDHVDEAAGITVRPSSWEHRGRRWGCRVELIAVSLGFYLATKPKNVTPRCSGIAPAPLRC